MLCSVLRRFGGLFLSAVTTMMCVLTGCVTLHPSRPVMCAGTGTCTPLLVCASPSGCASPPASVAVPAPPVAPAFTAPPPAVSPQALIFPPQEVMETGRYSEFVAENELRLQNCESSQSCDVALFNLGFAYAYPASPYRNLVKASVYFDNLRRRYPDSSYALPGKAWRSLILEQVAVEDDLRKVREQLRERDEAIRVLHKQMKQAKTLDIEMQEKERELLQLR